MTRITPVAAAFAAVALITSSHAWASAQCKAYPQEQWMKESDARAKLESQGYTIVTFKVAGECYELYGRNKEGKRVEIYYDAKTLKPVKTEIDK